MARIISLTTDRHFGEQLMEERKRQKLTQVEIEKRINEGKVTSNICHFEKGDNTFGNGSIQTVFKYAKALGYDEVNFKL